MEQALQHQQRYFEDLQKVLKGNVIKRDTNNLAMPKLENIDD
ncbi:MAG: hypothetical protein V9E88_12680 [Ferruginibacter sp.]